MTIKKKIIISVATMILSLGIAASIITMMLHGEGSYLKRIRDAEIRRTLNIDDVLKRTEEAVERGDELSYYYGLLKELDPRRMSPDQTLRYTMLDGDLLLNRFRRSSNQKNRQVFFDRAVKQYNIAAQLTSSPELRGGLYRRIARMNIENQNWSEALDNFKKAYPLIISPLEKWSMNLEMADCYINLKRINLAMDRINLAVGSDNADVASRAMLEKADIMVKAVTDLKLRDEMDKYFLEIDPEFQSYLTDKKVSDYLKLKASLVYNEVCRKLSNINPLYFRSQLGLLHLDVMNGNADEAYKLGNNMLAGSADRETMVKVMLELAMLEENRQNHQESIKILKKALQKYPIEAARLRAGLSLYNLYKKIQNWDAAFAVARNLFQSSSDPAAICKLINDFSGGSNMIFDIIIRSSDKDYYIMQLQQIFRDMESNYPHDWEQIKVNAYYVLAQLYFSSDDYAKAEENIAQCFKNTEDVKQIDEKVLRLDLICAEKLSQSPVEIICRARRYLNFFPKGPYYRNALLDLLRNYYSLGLYEPALAISRKIYADELDSAGRNIDRDQIWLETIAIISRCYFAMGEDEVANRLVKNFSRDILRKKYGGEIYYDWAEMAVDQKQIPEAIRRIDVALLYTTNPAEQLKLKVAQCLLLLKTGSLKDFFEAGKLFNLLAKDTRLDQATRAAFRRELLEEMLQYSLQRKMNTDFDTVFRKAVKDYPSAPWVQYWMLRALTPYFTMDNLQALSKKHEEILKHDADIIKDKESSEFIRTQLDLIKDLIGLENRYEKLKKSEGVNL